MRASGLVFSDGSDYAEYPIQFSRKDPKMICRREIFIDENPDDKKYPVKQIEQLTAIADSSKRFIGRVTLGLDTPMGVQTMPVTFEIAAATIEEAFGKFEARAEQEVEAAKKEVENQLQELRRRSQSRIVTPDQIAPGGMTKLQL